MTEKDATEKIKLIPNGIQILKNLFSKFTEEVVKLAEIVLKDGTKIAIDGDVMVGAGVMVVTESGTIDAPDGEMELPDGTILVIASGKIAEIKPAVVEDVPMSADVTAILKGLEDRLALLEKGVAMSDKKLVEANKVIEVQKTELKKQYEIQVETFKIVEALAQLPATLPTEKKSAIEPEKFNRLDEIAKNIQAIKNSK